MLEKIVSFSLLLFLLSSTNAQENHKLYNPSIDVQHYEFNIALNDSNNNIQVHAFITVKLLENTNRISFDLININEDKKGMKVLEVNENKQPISFTHQDNKITIPLKTIATSGSLKTLEIVYQGTPADGLIFSSNKFQHRTIFADNWPNRARNWLACVDHPSDKASVDFIITAPEHYQVISNGIKVEETSISQHRRLTHWKEEVALPTKIMTIGLAARAGIIDHPWDKSGLEQRMIEVDHPTPE